MEQDSKDFSPSIQAYKNSNNVVDKKHNDIIIYTKNSQEMQGQTQEISSVIMNMMRNILKKYTQAELL